MSHALPGNTLIAHSKALEAAGLSIALVIRVPAPLKSIADQVIRSASSVPANLTEGRGPRKGVVAWQPLFYPIGPPPRHSSPS